MRVTLAVISRVPTLGPTACALTTRVTGLGSRIDGTSTGSKDCVSTGRLEERIASELREVLAKRGNGMLDMPAPRE